jgi:hypothetical protein
VFRVWVGIVSKHVFSGSGTQRRQTPHNAIVRGQAAQIPVALRSVKKPTASTFMPTVLLFSTAGTYSDEQCRKINQPDVDHDLEKPPPQARDQA